MDYVREDLQFSGLSFIWLRKSQDRAGWRAAIECLLQRTRSADWKACYEWMTRNLQVDTEMLNIEHHLVA